MLQTASISNPLLYMRQLLFIFIIQWKSLFYLINIWTCHSIPCEPFRAGATLKSLSCLHAPDSPEAGTWFTFGFAAPRDWSWKIHSSQTFKAKRRAVLAIERNIHHGFWLARALKRSPGCCSAGTSCFCTALLPAVLWLKRLHAGNSPAGCCVPRWWKLRQFCYVPVLFLATRGGPPSRLVLVQICCWPG